MSVIIKPILALAIAAFAFTFGVGLPEPWAQTIGTWSSDATLPITTVGISSSSITMGGSLTNGVYIYPNVSHAPPGATFHQVVDVYYDTDGNKLLTESATHVVGYDCNPGKRQQELIAQDDGRGGVRFANLRLPSEPIEGVRPITRQGFITAMMAAKPVETTRLAEAK